MNYEFGSYEDDRILYGLFKFYIYAWILLLIWEFYFMLLLDDMSEKFY